jgi:hypothetical protein
MSGGICKPINERTGELGCWIIAHEPIGQLNQSQIFWHLDVYPTRAAAEEAKGPQGTVVESLGKVWLLTIADAGWRPRGGERIAEIGPLPITAGERHSAQYMEAIFTPGMTAPARIHSGPEAWYTLTGETSFGDSGRQTSWARRRSVSHSAGRPADAPYRDRYRDTPSDRSHSPRLVKARDNTDTRLDSKRPDTAEQSFAHNTIFWRSSVTSAKEAFGRRPPNTQRRPSSGRHP